MKNFKILIILFIAIGNFSCATKFSTPEMQNNFTSKQIEDLEKITDFFESQICENSNPDFKDCFTEMLPELVEYGWQPILENVDFKEQKKLYNSISKSTFDEIWDFTKVTDYESKLNFKGILPTYGGKYRQFLFDVGKQNKQIKEYYKNLEMAGDFESMGLLQQNIYQNPTDFDLDNSNIQLIIAVHYLSQNDQQKRKDKWEKE